MGLFRSEDMIRCQLFLQTDAIYQSVANLGEIGAVQFLDLNDGVNQFQRQFTSEIRRIAELQRKLRFFETELNKLDKEIPETEGYPLTPAPKELVDMETLFEQHEKILKEMFSNVATLKQHRAEMSELSNVLEKCEPFFWEAPQTGNLAATGGSEIELEKVASYELLRGNRTRSMWYSTGVLPLQKMTAFSKTVWLASHGNTILRFVDVPISGRKSVNSEEKSIFVAICQSDQLHRQLEKIAKGYKATIYPCPKTATERKDMLSQVHQRLDDLEIVIQKSKEQIDYELQGIFEEFYNWRIKLIKMNACYFTLNMFQQERHGYVAEVYVPVCELQNVQAALTSANESVGNKGSPVINPVKSATLPTFQKTNRFTVAFQAIIDSYGVANYKEINPAFFSIISFPFLFSVMFGDAGHGMVLFFFGLFLCIWEKKLMRPASKNEIYKIIFAGRYMVVLMGLFSVYSGFMYNDLFSKPVNFFGSKYHTIYDKKTLVANKFLQLDPTDPKVYRGPPYPLGVDPIWELAENKITYLNSFKKKISVIFGVSQMTLGVILNLLNNLYFRNYIGIFCEFIPMILFLMSIFGYMCALIFAKWLLVLESADPNVIASFYQCSPNILIGFINMFMMKYDESSSNHCSNHTWYSGQKYVQTALVLLALVCIFWLLLAKPLTMMALVKPNSKILPMFEVHETGINELTHDAAPLLETSSLQGEAEAEATVKSNKTRGEYLKQFTVPLVETEPYDIGEAFIHQSIHMIEFCLGCVSHTASYLRLWALSLAHAQLSDVLWRMVLKHGFAMGFAMGLQIVITYVLVCPFAVLTVVILLIMEGLSAFLHTLRLHWVEFNSKFYKGEGFPFQPFSFYDIINARDD